MEREGKGSVFKRANERHARVVEKDKGSVCIYAVKSPKEMI